MGSEATTDTDFVQFCFGRPSAVFSTGYTKFSGAIDHVVTQYFVEGGAAVHAIDTAFPGVVADGAIDRNKLRELVVGHPEKFAQLERLGALKAQGILTEEEFQVQKAKLLGM